MQFLNLIDQGLEESMYMQLQVSYKVRMISSDTKVLRSSSFIVYTIGLSVGIIVRNFMFQQFKLMYS